MTTIDVNELLATEAIVNDAPHTHAAWSPGDTAHQGDLIFVGLKTLPATAEARANRQLADGNTQGSRHVLADGPDVFNCPPADVAKAIKNLTGQAVAEQYIGPVFHTPATVTHPEHGDHTWPEDGVVACVYQRNLDAEQREQRVRD